MFLRWWQSRFASLFWSRKNASFLFREGSTWTVGFLYGSCRYGKVIFDEENYRGATAGPNVRYGKHRDCRVSYRRYYSPRIRRYRQRNAAVGPVHRARQKKLGQSAMEKMQVRASGECRDSSSRSPLSFFFVLHF